MFLKQELMIEDSENKKNIFIFIFFVAILGVTGIYLSIKQFVNSLF